MPTSTFRILEPSDFITYIRQTNFSRKIKFLQNHHTFLPNYVNFHAEPNRHMALLDNMRNDHVENRKWSDIGQNLTIFPDGKIGICRPINIIPAGIAGANTGGICIENLGDFDTGKDVMTEEQKQSIIKANAILCVKFGLKPNPNQIVYHHWFDTNGNRFSDSDIDSGKVFRNKLQKTCPGTNFFPPPGNTGNGNTIQSAKDNFYPLIQREIEVLANVPTPVINTVKKTVIAGTLNVRSGQGVGFPIIRKLFRNTEILVYETVGKWSRVSVNTEEWVNNDYIR